MNLPIKEMIGSASCLQGSKHLCCAILIATLLVGCLSSKNETSSNEHSSESLVDRSSQPLSQVLSFSDAHLMQVISNASLASSTGQVSIELVPCVDVPEEPNLSCVKARIRNTGSTPVQDVFFPDLRNLQPVAGAPAEETELRMGLGVINPFHGPDFSQEYSGGLYQKYALRWIDYGNYTRGLSVFQRNWGTETVFAGAIYPRPSLLVERSNTSGLRIAWKHHITLQPNQVYETDPYWFQLHEGGWAHGIHHYRSFAQGMINQSHWLSPNPSLRVPLHIKTDAAFQTAWMIESTEPECGAKTNFVANSSSHERDLTRLTTEAQTHGIREVVLFSATKYGQLPIPNDPRIGSFSDLSSSIARARQDANPVNFSLFFNVEGATCTTAACLNAPVSSNPSSLISPASSQGCPWPDQWWTNPDVAQWSFEPFSREHYWTYHSELLPGTEILYSPLRGTVLDPNVKSFILQDPAHFSYGDPQAISNSLAQWAHHGVASWTMDVFNDHFANQWRNGVATSDLVSKISDFRSVLYSANPNLRQATFAGEPDTMNLERAASVLDYTWAWLDYIEAGAYQNAVQYPRINTNVGKSTKIAKVAFLEGLYINAMPAKPGQANGSKLLSEEPRLALTLRQVSNLRKQFLAYFVDGEFIGESVLNAPVRPFVRTSKLNVIGGANADFGPLELPEIMVKGRLLRSANSLLIGVMNTTKSRQVFNMSTALHLWFPEAKTIQFKRFNSDGQLFGSCQMQVENGAWVLKNAELNSEEMFFCQINVTN